MGYYRFLHEEICVVRAWYQRSGSVEREIEETIEEETLHHVLYKRISLQACRKLHNVLKWNRKIEFKPIELEDLLRLFNQIQASISLYLKKNLRYARVFYHLKCHQYFKGIIRLMMCFKKSPYFLSQITYFTPINCPIQICFNFHNRFRLFSLSSFRYKAFCFPSWMKIKYKSREYRSVKKDKEVSLWKQLH